MSWRVKKETDDVGVVKADEEIDLCPDPSFVSLSFFLDNLEGDLAGWMDEPEDILAGSERETTGIGKDTQTGA